MSRRLRPWPAWKYRARSARILSFAACRWSVSATCVTVGVVVSVLMPVTILEAILEAKLEGMPEGMPEGVNHRFAMKLSQIRRPRRTLLAAPLHRGHLRQFLPD